MSTDRDRLAETIADHVFGLRDEYGKPNYVARQAADALLPVVQAIANEKAAAALRAAAQEQRNEAGQVPDTDEGTHADGHRCAADFLDRRADALDPS